MRKLFYFFCFFTLLSTSVFAKALIIKEVRIKGLKRVQVSVVRSKMSLKKGKDYSLKKVTQDVKALFSTGFFFDIKVSRKKSASGVILTYEFKEKPMISSIVFEGNDEFEDSELIEKLSIKDLRIFDADQILNFINEMKKMYEEEGFFLVKISYKLERRKKDQTNLVFTIEENNRIQIEEIQFFGNQKIPTERLKENIETKTSSGLFSSLFGGSTYKKEALERDFERLNFMYLNEGYLQVKILPPQVFVSQDKSSLSIVFRIEEGKKYYLGGFDFINNGFLSKNDLKPLVKLKLGGPYSYGDMVKTLLSIKSLYGDYGYAFCNVIPLETFKGDKVYVKFKIEIGQKFNFGRFSIKGNHHTRDYVLLRELDIEEGSLYSEKEKTASKINLRRLGFFEPNQINLNNKLSKTKKKEVDIEIFVKERPHTGFINVGGTYAPSQGFSFTGQIKEQNFLGKGQIFDLSFNLASRVSNFFEFSFTEPYFLSSKYFATFELSRSSFSRSRNITLFSRTKNSIGLRSGRYLSSHVVVSGGFSLNAISTKLGDETLADIYDISLANKNRRIADVRIAYDGRNDRFITTKGHYASVGFVFTNLTGSSTSYSKVQSNYRFYKKVSEGLIWRNNMSYSVLLGEKIPFDELLLVGGPFSLRGYSWSAIGPKKLSKAYRDKLLKEREDITEEQATALATVAYGGTQQFYLNTELQFPIFKELNFFGSVFYDIGTAGNNFDLDKLRSNFGFEILMLLPIGPLRFGWGFPIGDENNSSSQPYILMGPSF